jgi:hypothetical protein
VGESNQGQIIEHLWSNRGDVRDTNEVQSLHKFPRGQIIKHLGSIFAIIKSRNLGGGERLTFGEGRRRLVAWVDDIIAKMGAQGGSGCTFLIRR